MRSLTWLISLPIVAEAGEVLWSGFFNESATVADFDDCRFILEVNRTHSDMSGSWSNQVGDWQWYIHGSAATDKYLGLAQGYKNPADTSDTQGIRITIVGFVSSPETRLCQLTTVRMAHRSGMVKRWSDPRLYPKPRQT